jgi:hypothetical protein
LWESRNKQNALFLFFFFACRSPAVDEGGFVFVIQCQQQNALSILCWWFGEPSTNL